MFFMFIVTWFYPKRHHVASFAVRRTDKMRELLEPQKIIDLTVMLSSALDISTNIGPFALFQVAVSSTRDRSEWL